MHGARLTALDVPAAGADVTIDGSLFAGGEAPVLSVAAGKGPREAATLRVIRSTLLGAQHAAAVRPDPARRRAGAALDGVGRAAVAGRRDRGRAVIDLPKDAGTKAMTWRAVNCLYAGWETLLSGASRWPAPTPPRGTSTGPGRRRRLAALAWARAMPADPAEAPRRSHTFPGPTGYAATSGPGSSAATWGSCRGSARAGSTSPRSGPWPGAIGAIVTDEPPAVPEATDQLYHGEHYDLDKIDLGVYLHNVQKARKLAPTVVLHLRGTGGTGPARYESRMPT